MILFVLLAVPFLASASQITDHYSNVPMHEVLGSIGRSCVNKTGATLEELRLLHDYKKMSTTRASKCMVACVLETFGTVDPKDGSISYDAINLYFKWAFKPELHDTVLAAWLDCGKKVKPDPDDCEFIFAVTQCYIDVLDEINVKPFSFWTVKEGQQSDNP